MAMCTSGRWKKRLMHTGIDGEEGVGEKGVCCK